MNYALARPSDLPEAVINDNARTVLERRYFTKDENGVCVEDATGMFWRVASAIAAEEAKYEKSPYSPGQLAREFYNLMTNGVFLPNSPTLMNAGKPNGQLAACFVLPVGDSMEEIFDAVKNAAMIHKSGGGTGFSFSRLRPKDARVGSTGGVASGPVSFMRIFNTATEQVKQGGTRRGANMGVLRVDHPDILEFIDCKKQDGELTNFNISVAVTDAFMEAVESGTSYFLLDPRDGSPVDELDARSVFEKLVYGAWKTADPGILYIDRINRDNPTPTLGDIESTNPCGEVPLLPYEACNLGSINVSKFWLPEGRFDWDGFKRAIHLGVRFLDNVIDASKYPLPVIEENVKRNRKIGLGLMGVADLFFLNGRAYDSEETVEFAKTLMEFTRDEAWIASTYLADERGAFPTFEDSVWSTGQKLRNATTNTIAPTGTLSIIAGCSSGVEPLFALAFARHVMDGDKLVEANPHFIQALKDRGLYAEELMEKVIAAGSIAKMEELPADLRRVFVTAMDISPMAHLRMQAAFQQYTDNAVSKTVNLPSSATEDDIREIYVQAWELGCKGVTVYRDGCKADQVLRTGNGQAQTQPEPVVASPSVRQMRPEVVPGFTQKVRTGLGTLYLTVNEVGGKPFEIFATIGKSGRSVTAKAEAIGRLVSLALRSGVDVADVVEQIKGIGGENPIFREKGLLLSIPDAVAWVLECRYLRGHEVPDSVAQIGKVLCPDCGGELVFEEGCNVCKSCGYSRCAG